MNIGQIKNDIDFLCGSTSATYSDTNKIRNVNIAYQDVAREIWASDGTWNFDDSNNTDSPIAYRSLGQASANYLVPTTALRIEGVEIKDNGGIWHKLDPITYDEMGMAPTEYLKGNGLPIQYWLQGNEINLYPTPASASVTLASGMGVRLSRAVTEFATTASTTIPGFASAFHRILSLAASVDFTQDNVQRQFLLTQKDRLEKGLSRFYAKRADQFEPKIRPKGRSSWRRYL